MTSLVSTLLLWLGAYALHSTLFLAGAWLIDRFWKTATPALRSAFWRTALLASIATATLQTGGLINPVAGRFAIAMAPPGVSEHAIPPAAALAEKPQPQSPVVIAETQLIEIASPPAGSATTDLVDSVPVTAPERGFSFPQLDIGAILLTLWSAIVLVLSLRAAFMWWAAHRELRDRQPIVQGPLFERIQALAQDVGLRRLPQVSFSDRIAGPFTLPNGEICVPVWAREKLPQHQLDAMLAHEMAHVLHRDSLWLAIGMGVGTLFFFQPLNLIARKRLAHLAELAADDWAATRAGSGRPLAECISTFVDIAHAKAHAQAHASAAMRTPEFAAAMAKPKSELVERVERLLHNRYTSGALPMKARLMIGAGALALAMVMPGLTAEAHDAPEQQPASPAAPAEAAPPVPPAPAAEAVLEGAPALAQPQAPEAQPAPETAPEPEAAPAPEQPERSGHIQTEDNGSVRISITSTKAFDYRLTADARGMIKLAPDGSGVSQMGSGDFLDVSFERGGQTRRVRYTGEQGGVRREFWVGGQSRSWGAEADSFVTELMPILFRETGISANERVDWLLKQRGADALLAEIELIDSDSVTNRYMSRYLETSTVPAPTLERLLAMAGSQINSDSNLNATLRKAYATQKPQGRQLIALLKAARSIDSDSQAASLLDAVAPTALGVEDTASAYFDVVKGIDSDSQMAGVLSPIASSSSLSDARIGEVLALAGRDIDSDSQLAGLLHQAAARVGASDTLAKAYLDAASNINSDSQSAGVLIKLSIDARLSPTSWRMLLQRAARIGSDSQKAGVLTSVASRMPRQDDVVSAYRSATETIGSDSQRRGAEGALN